MRRAQSGIRWSPSGYNYRRGEPINGWKIAFASAPLNSVLSPTFLPGASSSLVARGLFHLNASVATLVATLASLY
jgi:hypothetical protein